MEKVTPHKHNGNDAERIEFTDLDIIADDSIADPAGGVTIDAQARLAISSILEVLRNKGFIKE